MKQCNHCSITKSLNNFGNLKTQLDGKHTTCKSCRTVLQKAYRRTKSGLIRKIYNDQKRSSKKRNYPAPTYTIKELLNFLNNSSKFNDLYDRWVKNNYNHWTTPSVDRLDDYVSYTLLNIQVTTWKNNSDRGHKDVLNGLNTKTGKAVIHYDSMGLPDALYPSIASASRETGINYSTIANQCKKEELVVHKKTEYRWIYYTLETKFEQTIKTKF